MDIEAIGDFDGSDERLAIVGTYDAGLILLKLNLPEDCIDER